MPLHPLVKEISRLTTKLVTLNMRRIKVEQEIREAEALRLRATAELTGGHDRVVGDA